MGITPHRQNSGNVAKYPMKKNKTVSFVNHRGETKLSQGITVSDEDAGYILVAVTYIKDEPVPDYPAVHYFPVSQLKAI